MDRDGFITTLVLSAFGALAYWSGGKNKEKAIMTQMQEMCRENELIALRKQVQDLQSRII